MVIRKKAAPYVRVSTADQAAHGLSIPDQLQAMVSAADQRGLDLIDAYVEPGATARHDKRPVFQRMISDAFQKPPPFQVIMVHSLSRFFRDEIEFEVLRRRLAKNGVEILSITQDFGDGPSAEIARRILQIADELNSLETSKHVTRTMLANARMGFWNGSASPLGYISETVEIRGTKEKKKLKPHPTEAPLVVNIFDWYIDGDGVQGPLGMKAIARKLNDLGHRTRNVKRQDKSGLFTTGYIEKILNNETYAGTAYYNQTDSKTGEARPKSDWVAVDVPALVTRERWNRAQQLRAERDPKKTPPRRTTNDVLLSGLVHCAACGRPMVRQTGKGGTYFYYRCGGTVREGRCKDPGTSGMSAPALDQIVVDRLLAEILTTERVQAIVSAVAEQRSATLGQSNHNLARHIEEQKLAKRKLNKLYDLVDDLEEDERPSDTLKGRIKDAEANGSRLESLIAALRRTLATAIVPLTAVEAGDFVQRVRSAFDNADVVLKKRLVRAFVGHVSVSSTGVDITGSDDALAEFATNSVEESVEAFVSGPSQKGVEPSIKVPSFTPSGPPGVRLQEPGPHRASCDTRLLREGSCRWTSASFDTVVRIPSGPVPERLPILMGLILRRRGQGEPPGAVTGPPFLEYRTRIKRSRYATLRAKHQQILSRHGTEALPLRGRLGPSLSPRCVS